MKSQNGHLGKEKGQRQSPLAKKKDNLLDLAGKYSKGPGGKTVSRASKFTSHQPFEQRKVGLDVSACADVRKSLRNK